MSEFIYIQKELSISTGNKLNSLKKDFNLNDNEIFVPIMDTHGQLMALVIKNRHNIKFEDHGFILNE